ncbi:peptidase M23B [Gottschalkia acidurici 9a]|uniref:Peptidase M23B n=1 Tax=Gottschalkia acidurici (strain ATCC 7906 / DSM 604 / BCRC 14475 / CIP 104303 / KCTC 5404 / NCIMB 10678 / 9a) TaxID=1128398 RepID=K0B4I7_GOTA9|nr:M23 family metallopeptidase [Gottschalkia acidurici]AFS79835.1 peptidase M23B [Gottschalkia acidurici 9a]
MSNSLLNKKIKKFKETLNLNNFKNNKMNIVLILITVISIVGLVQYKRYEIATRAVKVVFGKKDVGIARNKEEVLSLVKEIEKDLSKKYDNKIKINEKIAFVSTHVKDEELTSKNTIKKNINDSLTFSAVGYAIKVNDKDAAYVKSEEVAKQAIEKFKEPFSHASDDENVKVEDVKILEDVKLVKKKVPVSLITDIDTTLETLKTGNIEETKHLVKENENYWTMALDYNVNMEDIEEANPGKDAKNIKPGEEVNIPIHKPFITVATYEEQKHTEEVAFDTQYEVDDSLYTNEQKIKVEGVSGKTEVVAKVEKHNGIEVAKEILSETILSQPIAQVIVKGTKAIPIHAATGHFMTPARGTITSRFGARWGKSHQGIDIGARIGTPITASDGGTVIYSGYNNGGYGYMVEIDHGNGYVTRYAHCSKLYVNKGDKIAKGDVIAAVGNTGRSTGPHLHFEVRKNGVAQNPESYLN